MGRRCVAAYIYDPEILLPVVIETPDSYSDFVDDGEPIETFATRVYGVKLEDTLDEARSFKLNDDVWMTSSFMLENPEYTEIVWENDYRKHSHEISQKVFNILKKTYPKLTLEEVDTFVMWY